MKLFSLPLEVGHYLFCTREPGGVKLAVGTCFGFGLDWRRLKLDAPTDAELEDAVYNIARNDPGRLYRLLERRFPRPSPRPTRNWLP